MAFNPLGSSLGAVKSTLATSIAGEIGGSQGDGLYKINEFNWYQSLPYGFSFFNSQDSANGGNTTPTSTVYLPIAPSNINITTHFATNIVTTLYGIVEEHSEVRYYDIVISGTTGIAPRYTQPFSGISAASSMSPGRQDFESSTVPPLMAFISSISAVQTFSIANGVTNLAPDFLAGQDQGNYNHTGVGTRQTGYWAFHQLYQFFIRYKNDVATGSSTSDNSIGGALNKFAGSAINSFASGAVASVKNLLGLDSTTTARVHPIQFLNYKDGNKYDCVPLAFTLVRSAENPMLYNYNIKLKAFNLRSVTSAPAASSQLAKLGISGSPETDAKFQAFGSAMGGISALASTIGR